MSNPEKAISLRQTKILYDDLRERVETLDEEKYEKPATGIPASDLASDVTSSISSKLNASEKGSANGVAELDQNGKVPASQLPSFVDDVIEYNSLNNFPATGESGKIYVALDTNLAYRWSGSAYVEISPSLALGETSSTAYRGDRGKAAYDHAQAKGNAFANGLYKITTNSEGHVTSATAVTSSDISTLETDPTVPSWAKQSSKPTYTASEVGAPTVQEMNTALAAKYEKPVSGIPASDLATGVIPDVSGKEDILTKSYTTIMNATVTTASDGTHISPYATYSGVTLSEKIRYRVTVDGVSNEFGVGYWYEFVSGDAKGYTFLGNVGLYKQNVPKAIYDDGSQMAYCLLYNSVQYSGLQIFTSQAGNHTITLEKITYSKDKLPNTLLYGDEESPILKTYNNTSYESVSIGQNVVSGKGSMAIGFANQSTNNFSNAIGYGNTSSGQNSFVEGFFNTASGNNSHAEGYMTTASGTSSHAEGRDGIAQGNFAHAEGRGGSAIGNSTHVEGGYNIANAHVSHAEGFHTVVGANSSYQHVQGKYNVIDSSSTYADIVGNGTDENNRSNAFALDWNGNGYYAGDVYVGCNSDSTGGTKVATVSEIPDVSNKADKADTVLDTTLSRGRKANTTVGTGSFAFGNSVEASGNYSHAEGYNTKALGNYSHAEGHSAKSNGNYSHSEGQAATANGTYSHAEGTQTAANGYYSHAEGIMTTADGSGTHASGILNLPNNYDCYPEWVPNIQYAMNDKVKITSQSGEVVAYLCTEANADSSFDTNHWAIYDYMNYIEIVGNGYQELISKYDMVNHYSNARTLDRNGNEYLNGDIYINCNSDSTGGSKVLSSADFATDLETEAIITGWEVGA